MGTSHAGAEVVVGTESGARIMADCSVGPEIERRLHVGGKGACHCMGTPVTGWCEREAEGVQRLALQARPRRAAIERIATSGCSATHVDARIWCVRPVCSVQRTRLARHCRQQVDVGLRGLAGLVAKSTTAMRSRLRGSRPMAALTRRCGAWRQRPRPGQVLPRDLARAAIMRTSASMVAGRAPPPSGRWCPCRAGGRCPRGAPGWPWGPAPAAIEQGAAPVARRGVHHQPAACG